MSVSNLLKKILILMIVFQSYKLSAQISVYPSNGRIRIRRANALWEETMDQSTIRPGDSIKTGESSECLIKLNSQSYLIVLPNTLLNFSSLSKNFHPKTILKDYDLPNEFKLIKGGIVVRLSQNRNNSYFTLNTDKVFGGIKDSGHKTSTLFKVESNTKRDLWSIYEGKINLIARDPEAGSLSISDGELITISNNSLLKRSKITKVKASSPLGNLLKDQFKILCNAEKIEQSLLQKKSTQDMQPLIKMNLSLLRQGGEVYQTIENRSKKLPSKESSTAHNLSTAIDSCLSHSRERQAMIQQALKPNAQTYNFLPPVDKKGNEKLEQLHLVLKRIAEIKNEVNLNYKLQISDQSAKVNSGRIITELRLIKRQIETLNATSPTEAVQKMSNNLLRTINAIEKKLNY